MRRNMLILILIALGALFGCSSMDSPSSSRNADYKLQENIQRSFRSEWTWDNTAKEYHNLGDLKRDPETGLFPEPSPFPKELEGRAHWDPYLGLYVANSVVIDHEKGTITQIDPTVDPSYKMPPRYDMHAQNPFNDTYRVYNEMTAEKYYGRGKLSISYPDLDLFEKEGLTPEWFGLAIADLPMLKEKLEAGAPTAYTMSLISLLTRSHVEARPSNGNNDATIAWYKEFEALKSSSKERVAQGKTEGLGYLALPYLYDELKAGNDKLLPALPGIADGLGEAQKATMDGWDKEAWLNWFESQSETIEMIRKFNETRFVLPWLEQ